MGEEPFFLWRPFAWWWHGLTNARKHRWVAEAFWGWIVLPTVCILFGAAALVALVGLLVAWWDEQWQSCLLTVFAVFGIGGLWLGLWVATRPSEDQIIR